jgi:hypothetical protein
MISGVPLLACPAVHVRKTLLDKPAVAPAALNPARAALDPSAFTGVTGNCCLNRTEISAAAAINYARKAREWKQ